MAAYSTAAAGAGKVETRKWVLQAETELRFDVSAEHTLTVVVSLPHQSCLGLSKCVAAEVCLIEKGPFCAAAVFSSLQTSQDTRHTQHTQHLAHTSVGRSGVIVKRQRVDYAVS